MIDCTTDRHVHTYLCRHAEGTMEEYVLAAMEAGLEGIVFLEHLERGVRSLEPTWLDDRDFAAYWQEGERLKEVYGEWLNIGLGVEVGYNPERVGELRDFLGRYPWDRVGISYHFLEVAGRHHNLVSRKRENLEALGSLGVKRVLDRYFHGLLAAVEALPGTTLCHLDAALRHHPEVAFDDDHQQLIDTLLATLVARGMTLEVNTSGFPLRGASFPDLAILRRAADLGLRLEAGSDAHRPVDVGRFFDRLAALPL